jgi:hypothetical protein
MSDELSVVHVLFMVCSRSVPPEGPALSFTVVVVTAGWGGPWARHACVGVGSAVFDFRKNSPFLDLSILSPVQTI